MKSKIVILWCHPPSVSTAFARAFEQRQDFVKEMAVCAIRPNYESHPENPTVYQLIIFLVVNILFLFVHPKTIPSQYHASTRGDHSLAAGAYIKEFSPAFIGFVELQILFDFLTELTGTRPSVFDGADLLLDPEKFLTKYCETIVEHFELSMLTWKAEKNRDIQRPNRISR